LERIKHFVIFLLFSEWDTTKTILTVKESRAAKASDEAYGLTVKRDGTDTRKRIREIFKLSVYSAKFKGIAN
jgi:hypothetical protein